MCGGDLMSTGGADDDDDDARAAACDARPSCGTIPLVNSRQFSADRPAQAVRGRQHVNQDRPSCSATLSATKLRIAVSTSLTFSGSTRCWPAYCAGFAWPAAPIGALAFWDAADAAGARRSSSTAVWRLCCCTFMVPLDCANSWWRKLRNTPSKTRNSNAGLASASQVVPLPVGLDVTRVHLRTRIDGLGSVFRARRWRQTLPPAAGATAAAA